MIAVRRRRRTADIGGLALLVLSIGALSLALPAASHRSGSVAHASRPAGSPAMHGRHAGDGAAASRPAPAHPATARRPSDATNPVATRDRDGAQPVSSPAPSPRAAGTATSVTVSAAAVYSDTALPTNSYLESDTEVLLPATATVIGSSAAGMALDGASLPVRDSLSRSLFDGSTRSTYAYGQGGVITGLTKYTSVPDRLTARAYAPGSPATRTAALATATPPLSFDVVGADAEALGDPATMCRATTPFATGSADGATTTLLDMTGAPFPPPLAGPTVSVQGAFSTTSTLTVEPPRHAGSRPTTASAARVRAHAVVTLPKLVLFGGSPDQVSIKVTTPIELTASAGGKPGSARARVAPVLAGQGFAMTIAAGGQRVQLSASDLGLTGSAAAHHRLALPIGDEGRFVLGPSDVTTSADGTTVKAVADLAELDFFGAATTPTHAVDGLPASLAKSLAPLSRALQKVYRDLRPVMIGTTGTPEGVVQQLRLGHVETTMTVPHGGLRC